MRRLTILLLTLLLIGGHTAGLQLLAWSAMFAARVQTADSVGQALVSTLNGSKPCRLCQVVQELESHDQTPEGLADQSVKSAKKPHFNEPQGAILQMGPEFLYTVIPPGLQTAKARLPADVELPPPRS